MAAVEEEVEDRIKDIDIEALLSRVQRRPLTFSRSKSLYKAPEFEQRLKGEETVNEGSDLTLTFKVSGVPRPILRWFKDDEEVLDHPRLTVEEKGDERYRLTLHQVNKGDEAAYRCRAENLEGSCSCCFFLSVKAKPKSPKRDGKGSAHKRTVSFPTMFSTIVEKVEEEEKFGKETAMAPESPLTHFYNSLTLSASQTWPSFLGDWAFVNGRHKTRGGRQSSAGSEGDIRDFAESEGVEPDDVFLDSPEGGEKGPLERQAPHTMSSYEQGAAGTKRVRTVSPDAHSTPAKTSPRGAAGKQKTILKSLADQKSADSAQSAGETPASKSQSSTEKSPKHEKRKTNHGEEGHASPKSEGVAAYKKKAPPASGRDAKNTSIPHVSFEDQKMLIFSKSSKLSEAALFPTEEKASPASGRTAKRDASASGVSSEKQKVHGSPKPAPSKSKAEKEVRDSKSISEEPGQSTGGQMFGLRAPPAFSLTVPDSPTHAPQTSPRASTLAVPFLEPEAERTEREPTPIPPDRLSFPSLHSKMESASPSRHIRTPPKESSATDLIALYSSPGQLSASRANRVHTGSRLDSPQLTGKVGVGGPEGRQGASAAHQAAARSALSSSPLQPVLSSQTLRGSAAQPAVGVVYERSSSPSPSDSLSPPASLSVPASRAPPSSRASQSSPPVERTLLDTPPRTQMLASTPMAESPRGSSPQKQTFASSPMIRSTQGGPSQKKKQESGKRRDMITDADVMQSPLKDNLSKQAESPSTRKQRQESGKRQEVYTDAIVEWVLKDYLAKQTGDPSKRRDKITDAAVMQSLLKDYLSKQSADRSIPGKTQDPGKQRQIYTDAAVEWVLEDYLSKQTEEPGQRRDKVTDAVMMQSVLEDYLSKQAHDSSTLREQLDPDKRRELVQSAARTNQIESEKIGCPPEVKGRHARGRSPPRGDAVANSTRQGVDSARWTEGERRALFQNVEELVFVICLLTFLSLCLKISAPVFMAVVLGVQLGVALFRFNIIRQ